MDYHWSWDFDGLLSAEVVGQRRKIAHQLQPLGNSSTPGSWPSSVPREGAAEKKVGETVPGKRWLGRVPGRASGLGTEEGTLTSWVRKVHVMEKGRPIKTAMAICLAGFMIRLDIYIANISLPDICRYFNVGTGQLSYLMLAYLLMVTSSMLLFGKLGDRFGMKRILAILFFNASKQSQKRLNR